MSNSTSLSAGYNLNNEVNRVSIYIVPVIIAFILITNIINISVLCRKTLRLSSCTYYFIAMAVASLIYLPFAPLFTFLSSAYGISITSSPFGCRVQSFFIYSSALIFTAALACASVDRYCTSSSSVRLRRFSNPRVARRIILVSALLIILYLSPFLIIFHWDDTLNRCVQYSNTLIAVYLSSRLVLYDIVGPLIMAIFGVLTIHNIRSQQGRVMQPIHQNRHRRTEGQLSLMLIIQVGTFLVFFLPVAVTYILLQFFPSIATPSVNGVRSITVIWQLGSFFSSFFLYILSGGVYRMELKKMLRLNGNRARVIPFNIHPQACTSANNVASTRV